MFNKIYTTQELIQILEAEMDACIKGKRTFPMPENANIIAAEMSPLGGWLGAEKLFSIGVYHQFREQVTKYQLQNNISGLETKEYLIGDKIYVFPVPINQLELTPGDQEILRLSKSHIVDAFLDWCDDFTFISLLYSDKKFTHDIETTRNCIRAFSRDCDWAEITVESVNQLNLELGHGYYHDAPLLDKPDSTVTFFCGQRACEVYF